jgi:hypothetical protein
MSPRPPNLFTAGGRPDKRNARQHEQAAASFTNGRLQSEQQNYLERTGLWLRLERQCCRSDEGRRGPGWIPPRWRGRHCGVSVVTAQVPSQLKGIQNVAEQNLDKGQAFACQTRRKKACKVGENPLASGTRRDQAGRGPRPAAATLRCIDRRHDEGNRLAAAFRARLPHRRGQEAP